MRSPRHERHAHHRSIAPPRASSRAWASVARRHAPRHARGSCRVAARCRCVSRLDVCRGSMFVAARFVSRLDKCRGSMCRGRSGLCRERARLRVCGRVLACVSQAITNVAQEFTPKQFWTARREVEIAMMHAVNRTIFAQGHALVRRPHPENLTQSHHLRAGARATRLLLP
jgi:hypothetical protein